MQKFQNKILNLMLFDEKSDIVLMGHAIALRICLKTTKFTKLPAFNLLC